MASTGKHIRIAMTIHTDELSFKDIHAILFKDQDFDVLELGDIKIIIRDEETLDALFEAITEIRDSMRIIPL